MIGRSVLCMVLSVLCLNTAGLLPATVAYAHGGKPVRVLFVGNSLTNRNDLPKAFESFVGTSHPELAVETRMLAPDGETLTGHRARGEVQKVLKTGHWDYVILQEGNELVPGYTLDGTEYRTEPTQFYEQQKFFSDAAKLHGAKPVILEVWSEHNSAYVDYASMSAARDDRTVIAPVGRVWSRLAAHADLKLLAADKMHPTQLGTYMIAATLSETLFGGGKPVPAPDTAEPDAAQTLDAAAKEEVRALQRHAAFENLSRPEYAPPEPTLNGDALIDERIAGLWRAQDGGIRLSFGSEIRILADGGHLGVKLRDFSTSAVLEPEVLLLETTPSILFTTEAGSVRYTVRAVADHGDLTVLTAYDSNKTHRVYRRVTYRRDGEAEYFDRLHALYAKLESNERQSGLAAALKSHYESLPNMVDEDAFRRFRQGFPISEWDPILFGMYYADRHDPARALAYYAAAIELYPSSVDALVYYGKGLAAAGKKSAARDAFNRALGTNGINAAQKAAIEDDLAKLDAP